MIDKELNKGFQTIISIVFLQNKKYYDRFKNLILLKLYHDHLFNSVIKKLIIDQ